MVFDEAEGPKKTTLVSILFFCFFTAIFGGFKILNFNIYLGGGGGGGCHLDYFLGPISMHFRVFF